RRQPGGPLHRPVDQIAGHRRVRWTTRGADRVVQASRGRLSAEERIEVARLQAASCANHSGGGVAEEARLSGRPQYLEGEPSEVGAGDALLEDVLTRLGADSVVPQVGGAPWNLVVGARLDVDDLRAPGLQVISLPDPRVRLDVCAVRPRAEDEADVRRLPIVRRRPARKQ